GIKGKIVKKFEEKRTRSQSVPVVAKAIHSQSDGAGNANIDSVMLGPPREVLNYDDIERAEEADPERMASEQGLGNAGKRLDGVDYFSNEDDSWEKVDVPSRESTGLQQRAFYRDFAVVKARWIALDTAYIAARFPDVIQEMQAHFTHTAVLFLPLLLVLVVLPCPAFLKGFLVASLAWWTVWRVMTVLCSPASLTTEPFPPLPEGTPVPPPPLLMPRLQEMNVREGWLNALPIGEGYDIRTHQGSHSNTVHVRLVGTTLRIRTPKDKLPRRAMWDEHRKDTNAVVWLGKQWFVELEGATVRLQPEGLSAARLWNKKYPIVIRTLAKPIDDAKEIVLFARTCRDKEYWFRLLKKTAEQGGNNTAVKTPKIDENRPMFFNSEGTEKLPEDDCISSQRSRVDFNVYMNNLGLAHSSGILSGCSPGGSFTGSGTTEDRRQQQPSQSCCPPLSLAFRDADTQWLNVVVGRLLYDFFTQPRWAEAVRTKFQKKLSKIKVPFFMEELTITDIDLGSCTPLIRRTSAAVHCPETGVWFDLEIVYNGCFQATVHTKLNLMKLKKQGGSVTIPESREQEMQELAPGEGRSVYDDLPSEDDDDDVSEGSTQHTGDAELEEAQGATSKKILNMVDRISNWSLFQQATDYAFIRKKMEEFSNTDLKLTIQLTSLVGRLAINIPPPPADRLWYGFRSVPRLKFKAIPQMGEREVSFRDKLAGIIEKTIFQEFQRVLVMPNMDDLQIELMEDQPL
ncbi:testis-expressed sequence 2 protein-like, partial [Tropilaelaps mercedesae]